MNVPDNITQEYLDELSDELPEVALEYLGQAAENERFQRLRARIDNQVPDDVDIIADMTSDGYFTQQVELSQQITTTFRNIGSGFQDDCLSFAQDHHTNEQMRRRMLSKRRMAYCVLKINGQVIGPQPISGSLFDLRLNNDQDPKATIQKKAEERHSALDLHAEVIITQLSEGLRAWNGVLSDRLNSDTEDVLEKSTGTSDTAS